MDMSMQPLYVRSSNGLLCRDPALQLGIGSQESFFYLFTGQEQQYGATLDDRYKPGFQLQPEKLFEHNFVHIPDKLCVWFLNCKLGLSSPYRIVDLENCVPCLADQQQIVVLVSNTTPSDKDKVSHFQTLLSRPSSTVCPLLANLSRQTTSQPPHPPRDTLLSLSSLISHILLRQQQLERWGIIYNFFIIYLSSQGQHFLELPHGWCSTEATVHIFS